MFDLPKSLSENNDVQISRLRAETEADHQAVESSISLMSEDLRPEAYVAVLRRLYGIVSAWEELAEISASPELESFVRARARRRLLRADIEALRGKVPAERAQLPRFDSRSEFFGALYVMEGSRLGGQFIAKHVQTVLGLRDGLGTSYFRGFGEKTGSNWKELLVILETAIPEADSDLTVAAAKSMFRAFGEWMRGMVPTPDVRLQARPGESIDA